MDSIFQRIETEDIVIFSNQVYSVEVLEKCRQIHKELVEEGKLEGEFNADRWLGYSGVKKFGMDFSFDSVLYQKHVGKEFGISVDIIKNMLRCYAIYCNGVYVYSTIGGEKINAIKGFLQRYKDIDYRVTTTQKVAIKDFLGFIQTSDEQIEQVISNIKLKKDELKRPRQLAHIINYLVIENEINHIYRHNCSDDIFIKWFPIYFWVNITFIMPLRATEMLVTPRDCVIRENNKSYLKICRTKLKGGKRTVYYDVNRDYEEFLYEVPDTEVLRNIEKYIRITLDQERRFLFKYSKTMVNEMFSLDAFNYLLESFTENHILGNQRYDFARYATGIKEFELVTAGDSRPIAMANLYFQKTGADICRQLANHVSVNTSSGYYTNISETIWASSIIQLQKKLDYGWREFEESYKHNSMIAVDTDKSVCLSPKRLNDDSNLDDCVEQGHLSDCMGCMFYRPSKNELNIFMESQKKKADDGAKRVIEFMNNIMREKNKDIDLEDLFLSVQTNATRYRMGSDIKAKEKLSEWEKIKNIRKTNCWRQS